MICRHRSPSAQSTSLIFCHPGRSGAQSRDLARISQAPDQVRGDRDGRESFLHPSSAPPHPEEQIVRFASRRIVALHCNQPFETPPKGGSSGWGCCFRTAYPYPSSSGADPRIHHALWDGSSGQAWWWRGIFEYIMSLCTFILNRIMCS